jgi:hypothetical protein
MLEIEEVIKSLNQVAHLHDQNEFWEEEGKAQKSEIKTANLQMPCKRGLALVLGLCCQLQGLQGQRRSLAESINPDCPISNTIVLPPHALKGLDCRATICSSSSRTSSWSSSSRLSAVTEDLPVDHVEKVNAQHTTEVAESPISMQSAGSSFDVLETLDSSLLSVLEYATMERGCFMQARTPCMTEQIVMKTKEIAGSTAMDSDAWYVEDLAKDYSSAIPAWGQREEAAATSAGGVASQAITARARRYSPTTPATFRSDSYRI